MDIQQLVKVKKLKGKQNKKKWVKNVDVSGLLANIEKQDNAAHRARNQPALIVEDTTPKPRDQLNPDRFKNRTRSIPKPKYDNSYQRDNLIADAVDDIWNDEQPVPRRRAVLKVPAVIKPASGFSYNPRPEDVKEIVDEVIDYEGKRPQKEKKIKKVREIKVVPRSRNKKVRAEYLAAVQRKKERLQRNQLNSVKSLNKQVDEKNKAIASKLQEKESKKQKQQEELTSGKVREGPKLGKKRYQYKQYLPKEEELNKKLSKVGLSDELLRDRFDTVFRRGVMEPRVIKVHRNKTKNIKVKERFRGDD